MGNKYFGRKLLFRNKAYLILLIFFSACQQKTTSKKELESERKEVQKERVSIQKPTEIVGEKTALQKGWSQIYAQENLRLELKYATKDNFVKSVLYECPTCWLRPEAAAALQKVSSKLKSLGFGLVLYDCYRPRPVQQRLWDIVPNPSYVTPPKKGSMHNRGLAIDVGLLDRKGNIIDMGTDYDFFGPKAHHDFHDLDDVILKRRKMLKKVMEKHGFKGIRTEWWHYSYQKASYPLSDELWPCD